MWSAIGRRAFVGKPDRLCARRASSAHGSSGLDNVKRPPVPDVARKPARLPFLKSIYAGQYDVEALTYPETLNLERYKDLECRAEQLRQCRVRVDTVRRLGLFAMSAPFPSSGLNLTDTEIARVFEHFDCDTYKSVLDHTLAVDVIKTFGTPDQKSKYLPLLASGATCSLHNDTVTATALPDRSWELGGSVRNSADDVFSLFVVKNKGYIVEKDKIVVDGDHLELRRVAVSARDVIDNVDLTKVVQRGKLYTVSVLITTLKKVFNSTVMCVLPKNRLNLKLREYDSVLKILGKAVINMYTLESMIYLTTWMTDGFDNPDIELETAAIQLFARQTVTSTLSELKMLYGRNSTKEPFLNLCNDVDDIIDSLDGSIKLADFISNRGVEFFNKSDYQENVSFVTTAYRNIMMKKDEPSLKYGLKQFLHPALQHSADVLEYCVLKFQFIIDQSHNAGQLTSDNQVLMERLSTVIIYIYAMTAVLGRASRSYCTGVRFSDYDMNIAETLVRESKDFLLPIFEEIMSGKYIAIDSTYESIANHILVNSTRKEQIKT